jgi:RNA polymerase sigma factor (sigma-70 family)
MTPLLARQPRSDRAFERMYEKHVGDVYRYALVVLRNPADAEDVTQTTFLNAYRAFERGERPRTPQNWLIAIAHNVCRQRFRQAQRRPNEAPFEDELSEAPPEDDGPSAHDIRVALGHLAFNQRAAIVMRELEGRSYTEIAEVLGVSLSAVETLIFRARRALREQLEGGLTCHQAELAISKQLDDRLPRAEKGPLRAHLRECEECSKFARSQRAQRSAIRSLALIPVPSSLSSFFGHGGHAAAASAAGVGTAAGTGVFAKVALVGAAAIVATGTGVETARHAGWHPLSHRSQGLTVASSQAAEHLGPVAAPARAARGASGAATRLHRADLARTSGERPVTPPDRAAAALGRDRAKLAPGQARAEQKLERQASREAAAKVKRLGPAHTARGAKAKVLRARRPTHPLFPPHAAHPPKTRDGSAASSHTRSQPKHTASTQATTTAPVTAAPAPTDGTHSKKK